MSPCQSQKEYDLREVFGDGVKQRLSRREKAGFASDGQEVWQNALQGALNLGAKTDAQNNSLGEF